jgi:TonB-dependent receptor
MFLPFTVSDRKQSFRAGGSTVIRIRDFRSRIFQYEAASFNGFDEDKAFLPFDQVFSPENIAVDGYVLDEFTNNDDKYFGVSALNAMYVMFDNKIGEKIRLVWGVRAENFQQFLTTKNKSAQRVIVETGKWDVLPSFNFTFSPDTRNSVRIAGSRTVARPEFREIAPFSFYDYESNYGVNGNPGLLRTAILNGDIRYEFYPKGGEAITVGGFYKHFDDPIELRLDNSSVIDRRNYGYTNADKAYTAGVEFEIRKNLDIINKRLQDFSVFANLTYTYSKVNLQGSKPRSRPLQGQSPYLANLGLQYNSKAGEWSGTILFNRMGQRLALVGNDEFPDVYERPRDQLDIQLAKKLFHERAEIRIVWADIFNQQYFFYENTNSSKAFNSGKDRLFYAYTPGSTVTLGFTYNFNPGKK